MTVRTRGVTPQAPLATRRISSSRTLIGALVLALIIGGAFFIGRRTAPTHRHALFGSLDRALDVTVGPCTKEPTSASTPGIKIAATVAWRSGWKNDEFPYHRESHGHRFESNVHIGVSWDTSVWRFADLSRTHDGSGWSVGPSFTPSGHAAESWAIREATRRGLIGNGLPRVPDTFMQQIGPGYGVWVLENFYDDKPEGRWTGGFTAYNVPGPVPKPSSATIALIDVDGSVMEKTVSLSCPSAT